VDWKPLHTVVSATATPNSGRRAIRWRKPWSGTASPRRSRRPSARRWLRRRGLAPEPAAGIRHTGHAHGRRAPLRRMKALALHSISADRVAHPPAGGRGEGQRAAGVAICRRLAMTKSSAMAGRASGKGHGHRRGRRIACGLRRARTPAPVGGRRARDGPRRVAGWPGARRGRGTAAGAGGVARGLRDANPWFQALERGHRVERRARRNDGGVMRPATAHRAHVQELHSA